MRRKRNSRILWDKTLLFAVAPFPKMPQKERKAAWIAAGLCSTCGKRQPEAGYKRCSHCKEAYRSFCKNHPERIAQHRRQWYKNLKLKVLAAYGRVCACCKEENPFFLAIDHINNDGAKQRALMVKGKFYAWLKRNGFPSGYRVLCHKCNLGRHLNGGTCPHGNGT
jgi:hypothetical protein